MTVATLRSRQKNGGTPTMKNWGVDSEFGVLKDVLLGPPDNYRWLPSNSTAQRSMRMGYQFDQQQALEQHTNMAARYEAAGVRVHQLEADTHLPYQIYARDSSVMTPWGAIVSQMSNHWRRGEHAEVIRFYQRMNIPIFDMVTTGTFEGGDFQIIKPGVVLCGFSGERTSKEAIDQVSTWFEAESWEFYAYEFDPFYLHADVFCSMLAEGLAAVCTDAVEDKLLQWLKSHGIDIVDIPFKEAMNNMGCNVVALGNERVLLPESATGLQERCRAHGLQVNTVDISMIALGGGGLHCMCQSLHREPLA